MQMGKYGQHLSSHISLDGSSSLKTELNAPMTATLQTGCFVLPLLCSLCTLLQEWVDTIMKVEA